MQGTSYLEKLDLTEQIAAEASVISKIIKIEHILCSYSIFTLHFRELWRLPIAFE